MKKSKVLSVLCGCLLVAANAVLLVGLFTFLQPCAPMKDGTYMTCHWAGQALLAVSGAMTLLSVLAFFMPKADTKAGLCIAITVNALAATFVPGRLIPTCMMGDMQCNAVMRPGVAVLCVVIALLALLDMIVAFRAAKKAVATQADSESKEQS